jgi:hypothetical protein
MHSHGEVASFSVFIFFVKKPIDEEPPDDLPDRRYP